MTTTLTAEPRVRREMTTFTQVVASPYFFWVVLAFYLTLHVTLRLWETPNITKNDVQEALAAQGWAWGYHPRNPPLHTWLLMASYSVFGVGLMAHVVLKYVLLGATYIFAYLCGRRLLSDRALATLSALSLAMLSPFAWTVHTAWTHTLLLAAINFAALWAAIRMCEYRRTRDYVLFGVFVGLGFLAKYSFALFLIPLIAAMLCQLSLRRALIDARVLLSAAIALLILAPHLVWMATAQFDFVTFLADKQRSAVAQPYFVDAAVGAGNVTLGLLGFLAPLVLVFPVIFRGAFGTSRGAVPPWAKATALMVVFGVGLLLLDVFVLRATEFEARYFTCAALVAPLCLFQWLERRTYGARALGWFVASMAVVALIAVGGLAGRALTYHRDCSRCWEEMNVAALVNDVRLSGFSQGTIITPDYNVGGNLSVAFPRARVMAANYEVAQAPFVGRGQCLLAWNARVAGDAPPELLTAYANRIGLVLPQAPPRFVNAPLRRSADRVDRFAYWIVPGADGNCAQSGG